MQDETNPFLGFTMDEVREEYYSLVCIPFTNIHEEPVQEEPVVVRATRARRAKGLWVGFN
jgi:hypothetical protein